MRLILLHEAHRRIQGEIDLADRRETGGLLLGWRRTDLELLVVAEATGPGRDAVQTPNRLVLDSADLQHAVVKAFERSGGDVVYLGDWHLHHEQEPTPSTQDRCSVRKLAESPEAEVPEPLLLIAGKEADHLTWRAWHGLSLEPVSVTLQPGPVSDTT